MNAGDLLGSAERLLTTEPGRPADADLRRAASRIYYAAAASSPYGPSAPIGITLTPSGRVYPYPLATITPRAWGGPTTC